MMSTRDDTATLPAWMKSAVNVEGKKKFFCMVPGSTILPVSSLEKPRDINSNS